MNTSSPFHFPRPFAWFLRILQEMSSVSCSRREVFICRGTRQMTSPRRFIFHGHLHGFSRIRQEMSSVSSSRREVFICRGTRQMTSPRRFIFHGLLHWFSRIRQEMSSVSCLDRWTPHGSPFHFPRPFA